MGHLHLGCFVLATDVVTEGNKEKEFYSEPGETREAGFTGQEVFWGVCWHVEFPASGPQVPPARRGEIQHDQF